MVVPLNTAMMLEGGEIDDTISAIIDLTTDEDNGEDDEPAMPVKVAVTEMEVDRTKTVA